jgi:hypothetical protein
MNTVILTKEGVILQNGKTAGKDFLRFLSFRVALEEGYLFRSFLKMIDQYEPLAALNAFFPAYLEQYREGPKSGCTCDDLDHLEFCKTVEMIGFPGKPRLEIYNAFYGVRADATCEIRSLPMEALLDMPLRLGRLKHVVFGDKVDIFEFDTDFNLFEFIDGIVWELSFHNIPKHCDIRR